MGWLAGHGSATGTAAVCVTGSRTASGSGRRSPGTVSASEWVGTVSDCGFGGGVTRPAVHTDAMNEPTPRPAPSPTARTGWRPLGPPDNEIPRTVPINSPLGRGPDAALFITSVQAYRGGVQYTVSVRLRRRTDHQPLNLMTQFMGGPTRDTVDPERRLLIGVELSDGRRAVMVNGLRPPSPTDEAADSAAVTLAWTPGGLHNELAAEARYWMTPLPPPGPLLMVLRWLELGIEETVTELDGTAIAAAGHDAEVLWPPAPPLAPPHPPAPPTTGWFAQPHPPLTTTA